MPRCRETQPYGVVRTRLAIHRAGYWRVCKERPVGHRVTMHRLDSYSTEWSNIPTSDIHRAGCVPNAHNGVKRWNWYKQPYGAVLEHNQYRALHDTVGEKVDYVSEPFGERMFSHMTLVPKKVWQRNIVAKWFIRLEVVRPRSFRLKGNQTMDLYSNGCSD